MRSIELLARFVFTLLLVTSGNTVADDADTGHGQSVTYLETLLIQSLNDEGEFPRHAIQYLALTGQDSQAFVDTLAASHPLPPLLWIQQFQNALSDCSGEKPSLLAFILSIFARESPFALSWEKEWEEQWQEKLENKPNDFLLHWLAREWIRLTPGGGNWKAERFWEAWREKWLTNQQETFEWEVLETLHYPAPCQHTQVQGKGAFGLPGADANYLHDRGGGRDVVIRPGGPTPYHPHRQTLEHAAQFHNFATSHPSRRDSASHQRQNPVKENRITWLPSQPNSAKVYKGNAPDPIPSMVYARELHETGVQQTTTPAHIQQWKAFVLTHPAVDVPLLVMLSVDPRYLPGVVTGQGQDISRLAGNWLDQAGEGVGAPIPKQVAEKLRGREFASFDKFREAFWTSISEQPELLEQFNAINKARITAGSAPRTVQSQHAGGRKSFEIHHLELISEGGEVYHMDNMRVMTPKRHVSIHSKR